MLPGVPHLDYISTARGADSLFRAMGMSGPMIPLPHHGRAAAGWGSLCSQKTLVTMSSAECGTPQRRCEHLVRGLVREVNGWHWQVCCCVPIQGWVRRMDRYMEEHLTVIVPG